MRRSSETTRAGEAATVLVATMTARDDTAWVAVRDRFSALAAKAEKTVSAELDQSRSEVVEQPELADEAVGEWKAKLRRLLNGNPQAAGALRELVRELTPEQRPGTVHNVITGDVSGVAIQAGTIHGGIHKS